METKKVVIHAGFHKTGTTSIQLFCQANRQMLLEHGILYPGFDDANHSVPLSLLFMEGHGRLNHSVSASFPSEEARADAAGRFKRDLIAEIAETNPSTVLLSGEDLSLFTKLELEAIKAFFLDFQYVAFEIVIYARHPINFAISAAQELVRAGLMTFGEAFKMGNLQRAMVKIQGLEDVFGANSIHVFSFDDAIAQTPDIVSHFVRILGVPDAHRKNLCANAAMSLEKTLALSAIKASGAAFVQQLSGMLPDKGSRIIPNESLRQILWAESEGDRAYLSKNHGVRFQLQKQPVPHETRLDPDILKSHLQLVQAADRSLAPEWLVGNIVADIQDMFPETAQQIREVQDVVWGAWRFPLDK